MRQRSPSLCLRVASVACFLLLFGFMGFSPPCSYGAQQYDLKTLLAASLYLSKDNKVSLPVSLKPLTELTRFPSGVEARAYENAAHPDSVLVAFRGTQTDDPQDVMADMGIVGSQISGQGNDFLWRQVTDAEKFIDMVSRMKQKRHGNRPIRTRDITVTGCSLGGFLTQAVTVRKRTLKGITFNAPGALKFVSGPGSAGMAAVSAATRGMVDNHRRDSDPVGNFGRHVGRIWKYPDYVRRATYVSKPGCGKGNFADPRNGGECWSCEGWDRTVFHAVDSGKACARTVAASYHRAEKKRQNTHVGQGCPRGEFWDVKGGNRLLGACYSCEGNKRTVFAVDSDKACERPAHETFKRAKFIRKSALCPSGSFFDPRNLGECWSCPKGFDRGTAPVDKPNACLPPNFRVENHKCDGFYVDISRGMKGVPVAEK